MKPETAPPDRQIEHGKLQMLGAAALVEGGTVIPNLVWGAAAIVSGLILGGYGLKDWLVGHDRRRH